jgi:hypothetical protein
VRLRNRPPAATGTALEAVTARILGLGSATITLNSSVHGPRSTIVDPVTRTLVSYGLDANRPNRSLRFEAVEIDPRVQSSRRTAWKGRLAGVPDRAMAEVHTNEEPGGGFFFAKVAAASAFTDGVVWGEPAAFRPTAGDPRGVFAGIGNVAATLVTAPGVAEYVDLGKVPASHAGEARYAAGQTLPMTHPPTAPVKGDGARIQLGGRLEGAIQRIVTFEGDEAVCLDPAAMLAGQRSRWREIIVPILTIAPDPVAAPDASMAIWLWTYASPLPGPPPPGPAPGPCAGQPAPPAITHGQGFRIGEAFLVDLALREYTLSDASNLPSSRWNGFRAMDDDHGTQTGIWRFDKDVQMKGYRGEITIVDQSPSFGEPLGNPYGDWKAGPGLWYLRARDALPLLTYKGDISMGNTANGFLVPLTNGVFSTLSAIYQIVWP